MTPYSPSSNELLERTYGIVLSMVQSSLTEVLLPQQICHNAVRLFVQYMNVVQH